MHILHQRVIVFELTANILCINTIIFLKTITEILKAVLTSVSTFYRIIKHLKCFWTNTLRFDPIKIMATH